MKKKNAVAALIAVAAATATASAAEPPRSPNWNGFLSRQDLVWDDANAESIQPGFYNGAFLGDGSAGGMLFRDPAEPQSLRWLMGRYDVVAHEAIPKFEYCNPRLFAGDILLTPIGRQRRESMRLSLENGEASGTIETDRGKLTWRAYVHRTEHVFVFVVKSVGAESGAALRVREQWGITPVFYNKKRDPADFATYLPPKPITTRHGDVTLITQPLRVKAAHAVAWSLRTPAPDTKVLMATIGAAYDQDKPVTATAARAQTEALDRLAAARAIPLEKLDETHRRWWRQHLRRSRLELPDDPTWEAFWWRQIYKFAAASAEDSSLLIDNEGPWAYNCDWGAVWWNLNVQLSYFPTFSANRLDVGRSLIRGMDRIYRSGALNRNAGKWSDDSIWIGRSTDYKGEGSWGDEVGNLTWTLHNCWRYWRYSGDESVGRWLYPLLKQDVNHYLHLLQEGTDGRLHLPPSRSPEYEDVLNEQKKPFTLMADANYALASLHWALQTLTEMNRHFGFGDPDQEKWDRTARRLVALPTGDNGLKVAGDVPFEGSHRHYSHLLAIYPYHLITPDQGPEAVSLIRRSVDHWTSMPKAFAGYSFTGACAMYATLGDGDRAIGLLDNLLKRVRPNTLYTEGDNQVIETPLSAVESIDYLLLQSWGGTIRPFPAVPSRWRGARFDDFAAEGGFLVSGERRDGRTAWITVRSVAGNPARIKLPADLPEGAYTLETPNGVAVSRDANGLLTLSLKKGQTLKIVRAEP